ncbi:hypothetical protein ACXJJ3_17935 [Kribbella sp. WER1]
MNAIPGLIGPYTGCTDVQLMHDDLARQLSLPWRNDAQHWTDAGTKLHDASGQLAGALNNIQVWRRSSGSDSWKTFNTEVTQSVTFLEDWKAQTANVAQRMTRVAEVLDSAREVMDQYLTEWKQADEALKSDNELVRNIGKVGKEQVSLQASVQMNILSELLGMVFDGLQADFAKHDWPGPEVAKPGGGGDAPPTKDQGGGGDQAKAGGGTGTDGGAQPKVSADDKNPADKKPDDKQPEAKDPIEEAGKFLDVVAKVPEIADKGITALQHLKDLLTPSTPATTTTVPTTTTTDPAKSSMDGLVADHPSLAGGTTATAPTFHPSPTPPAVTGDGLTHLPTGSIGGIGNSSLGHQSNTKETTPVQKSTTVAGSAGSEPTLAGKTSTTGAATTQQSTPPMYPPQNGGMGAGGNGARDIKPGAGANRKPGFNVPAEQSETERMRRNGVQSDLQGRNGEQRAAGVPQRKRRRTATRAVERDVLDEDLWRIQ